MANFLPCSGALRGVILVSVMTVKLLRRILAMSPPAWEITLRSLQLSCVMLFCSWMLLAGAGFFGIGAAERVFNGIGIVALGIAAVLTVWSGISYIVKNRQVLGEKQQ